MQILMKIDEDQYKFIKQSMTMGEVKNYHALLWDICERIKNSTPLPKGHGRLIDADELKRHKYHDNNRFENAVAVAQIDWADTIIEADKENEMSIVIIGKDMPTGCMDCPCRHHDEESMEEICQALNKIIDLDFHSICIKRMLDCPLKELKNDRPDNN